MITEKEPGTGLAARIPGSKSLTNRLLLLAAAADGTSTVRAPLVSEDTVAFREALGVCGIPVQTGPGDTLWKVTGTGRGPTGSARPWCADAGTAARFLPPFAATGHGSFLFDGSSQLRARPQRPLIEALRALGADLEPGPGNGLPLLIRAQGIEGGDLSVDSSLSSQYLSGLLMAAPLMRRGLRIRTGSLVSRPYIDMTLALMRRFGAHVDESTDGTIDVAPRPYDATDIVVEPDASSASYVFAAAAVTGRTVTVPGLGTESLQGDLRFVDVLRRTGADVHIGPTATTVTGDGTLRGGFTVDMGEISDTFMTLAAIAPLADAPITITGVAHARLKESDRVAAMAENLRACGIETAEGPDRLTIHPGVPRPTRIACHRDHRIAMSFSVLGLAVPDTISLDDPDCVAKTFPEFHDEIRRLFQDGV
ncbi:3-phosphoshikimate 1-carboxyvinyltransferase [Streptomyces sp. Je 1-369]|uniref:3-phosphoshikimate 1-carboxyvinyltransferase n=1 Tax=Streptomyces sp. Je 1-369 TaxID=2966192 RepID=UPI002285D32E|nr:3-phosphoshikimate 1-carboxyvinyltransferase [Streptomyces sp. Je 1-369]WAL98833.1 3-phosphoshikimate 1-carboxyvinyltransferase [Streptomyces sp. Je 1-369]